MLEHFYEELTTLKTDILTFLKKCDHIFHSIHYETLIILPNYYSLMRKSCCLRKWPTYQIVWHHTWFINMFKFIIVIKASWIKKITCHIRVAWKYLLLEVFERFQDLEEKRSKFLGFQMPIGQRSIRSTQWCVCCRGCVGQGEVPVSLTNVTPSLADFCVSVAVASPRWKQGHCQLCRVSAPMLQPDLLYDGFLGCFKVIPLPSPYLTFVLLLSFWATIIYLVLAIEETDFSGISLNLSVWNNFHRLFLCPQWMTRSVNGKCGDERVLQEIAESVWVWVWAGRTSSEAGHIWSHHMPIYRENTLSYICMNSHSLIKWLSFLSQNDSISTDVWKCV